MRFFGIILVLLSTATNYGRAQVYASHQGDTTKIWDAMFRWNCIVSDHPMYSLVRQSHDTIAIVECDTTEERVRCECQFTTCTNLVGLLPGSYVAVVTRLRQYKLHTPSGDTTISWTETAGSVTFEIEIPPSLSASVSFIQSKCLSGVGVVPDDRSVPVGFAMLTNYPNPFNPTTVVSAQWPTSGEIRLAVYDMLGHEVAVLAEGRYPAGRFSFQFDGRGLSSGAYYCRLTLNGSQLTRGLILTK